MAVILILQSSENKRATFVIHCLLGSRNFDFISPHLLGSPFFKLKYFNLKFILFVWKPIISTDWSATLVLLSIYKTHLYVIKCFKNDIGLIHPFYLFIYQSVESKKYSKKTHLFIINENIHSILCEREFEFLKTVELPVWCCKI